jgi:t-SNARE complex subunit (syntaxin)
MPREDRAMAERRISIWKIVFIVVVIAIVLLIGTDVGDLFGR